MTAAQFDGFLAQLGLGWHREVALEGISAPRQWFIDKFAEGSGDALDVAWRRTPFEQRPFIRKADGDLVLTSPRALISWMGDGFQH